MFMLAISFAFQTLTYQVTITMCNKLFRSDGFNQMEISRDLRSANDLIQMEEQVMIVH